MSLTPFALMLNNEFPYYKQRPDFVCSALVAAFHYPSDELFYPLGYIKLAIDPTIPLRFRSLLFCIGSRVMPPSTAKDASSFSQSLVQMFSPSLESENSDQQLRQLFFALYFFSFAPTGGVWLPPNYQVKLAYPHHPGYALFPALVDPALHQAEKTFSELLDHFGVIKKYTPLLERWLQFNTETRFVPVMRSTLLVLAQLFPETLTTLFDLVRYDGLVFKESGKWVQSLVSLPTKGLSVTSEDENWLSFLSDMSSYKRVEVRTEAYKSLWDLTHEEARLTPGLQDSSAKVRQLCQSLLERT